MLQKHGAEAVAEIAIFEMAHVKAIKDLVEKEQIDCDLVLTRALHVTRDEDMAAGLESLVKTIQSSMSQFGNDWKYQTSSLAEEVCIICTKIPRTRIDVFRLGLWD